MANPKHAKTLRAGKTAWRKWRKQSSERPDLSGEDFDGLDMSWLDLEKANFRGARLRQGSLRGSRLMAADLTGCDARSAVLSEAKLAGAKLVDADLRAASLRRADLRGANLSRAVLRFTSLVGANVTGTKLRGAEVYGVGAWNLKGEPADQRGLIIREKEGAITTTVDDLDTAQFLFLLRENAKIANIIDTASQRTVLLLGRFKPPYKAVLDALKAHLLARNLVPVLFDFTGSQGRDLTETVASLAHMACFVIPDLSGARSVPQELSHIVPFLPSVPVVPVISQKDQGVYSMFEHFRRYPWVHAPVRYRDVEHLLSIVDKRVIDVGFAEAMKARGITDAELPRAPKTRRPRKRKTRKPPAKPRPSRRG